MDMNVGASREEVIDAVSKHFLSTVRSCLRACRSLPSTALFHPPKAHMLHQRASNIYLSRTYLVVFG
jgi:hypothetical protein